MATTNAPGFDLSFDSPLAGPRPARGHELAACQRARPDQTSTHCLLRTATMQGIGIDRDEYKTPQICLADATQTTALECDRRSRALNCTAMTRSADRARFVNAHDRSSPQRPVSEITATRNDADRWRPSGSTTERIIAPPAARARSAGRWLNPSSRDRTRERRGRRRPANARRASPQRRARSSARARHPLACKKSSRIAATMSEQHAVSRLRQARSPDLGTS